MRPFTIERKAPSSSLALHRHPPPALSHSSKSMSASKTPLDYLHTSISGTQEGNDTCTCCGSGHLFISSGLYWQKVPWISFTSWKSIYLLSSETLSESCLIFKECVQRNKYSLKCNRMSLYASYGS